MISKDPKGTYYGTQILTRSDLYKNHLYYNIEINRNSFVKPRQFFYEASFIIFVDNDGEYIILKNRVGPNNKYPNFLEDLRSNDIIGYNKLILTINICKNKIRKHKIDSL
jgi:arginine repressor